MRRSVLNSMLVFFSVIPCLYSQAQASSSVKTPMKVIHSSDAGADDYVASAVLTLDANVDLLGIVVTNADCVPEYAMSAYGKFVKFFERDIPFGLSESRTWNQFPWHWRADTIRQNHIPSWEKFSEIQPHLAFSGDKLLGETLSKARDREVIVVATGPLTTLADLLKAKPELGRKIRALYWMGGAIDVPGNVPDAAIDARAGNKHAEWNVFADAYAADHVFKTTTFEIHLIPLDLTNHAKITDGFLAGLKKLQEEGFPYAGFILESYKAVCDLGLYSMWDVVTAATVARPDLFATPKTERLNVLTSVDRHGAIVRHPDGRPVRVYYEFKDGKVEAFHDYLLSLVKVPQRP